MKKYGKKILTIVFLVLYLSLLVFMVIQSLSPAVESSEQSSSVGELVSRFKIFDVFLKNGIMDDFTRKFIGHFCEFGLLGIFGYFVFGTAFKKEYSQAINCAVGLSSCSVVETFQLFAEGRAVSFFDIVLDFEGYLTALSILTIINLIVDLIVNKGCKNTLKNSFYTSIAYVFVLIAFAFYNGDSFGVIFSHLVFISFFAVCLLLVTALVITNKISSTEKNKH